MKHLMVILILLASSNCFAGMPTCHQGTNDGYCKYNGKVSQLYVNASNVMLIYFDTAMPVEDAENASLTITNGGAGAYLISDNPDFAKLFYSTALAAQASNRNVNVQLRGTVNGYLKFDRIWLAD